MDGVRGLALLVVFGCHTDPTLLLGGHIGVDLFFVLSGFLITRILLDEVTATGTINFRNFYIRRALRLLPAVYSMALLVVIYVDIVKPDDLRQARSDALSVVFYYYNWVRVAAVGSHVRLEGFFGHLWSLSVEEQFYIFWPLVLVLAFRCRAPRPVVLAIIAAGIVYPTIARLLLLHRLDALEIYFRTDLRIDMLMWGALGAWLITGKERKRIVLQPRLADALGVLALGTFLYTASFEVVYSGFLDAGGYTPIGVVSGFLVLAVAMNLSPLMTWLFSIRFLRWTGKISYGLYIWHIPVFYFVLHLPITDPYPIPLRSVLAVAATYLVAWASFKYIEAPFLAQKDTLAPRARTEGMQFEGT